MKTTLSLALFTFLYLSTPLILSQYSTTVSELNVNGRTKYDMQSLGSAHMLEVNPSNPQEMHACFLVSTDPPPGYANRNVRYFYTSNAGTSWDYIGEVALTRAGFPSLTTTNDNRAVILTSSSDIGTLRTLLYVDVFNGAGTWTTLDPGLANSIAPLNPVGVTNRNINNVFFTCSPFRNACFNLNSPGTFTGYINIDSNSGPTMSAISVSYNNKVGIAYITGIETNVPPGSVKFVESTNNGLTWAEPVTVWAANYNTDSLAALRGIDCAYKSETPNVVFEVCKRSPVNGEFFPKKISHIIFWSPNINNGIPQKIDSSMGLTGTNPNNDVFSGVCRPVIGYHSGNSQVIFLAYCKARNDTDAAGNNFFDIYIKCSRTYGAYWSIGNQLTNTSGPLRDYRYPSISHISSNNVHITAQQDSIPGSSVNGSSVSNAQIVYLQVYSPPCSEIGIQNTGTEISEQFELKQNYPNPFNPVTQIEFSLPENSYIKLKVFNAAGQLVNVLADREFTQGNYKADFDAAELASGIYYYVMEYREINSGKWNSISKKMVLIK